MKAFGDYKERRAASIVGSLATIFFVVAILNYESGDLVFSYWCMGIALGGYALALSPHVLFERVSLDGFRMRGPMMYGSSAAFALLGNACFILAIFAWLAS